MGAAGGFVGVVIGMVNERVPQARGLVTPYLHRIATAEAQVNHAEQENTNGVASKLLTIPQAGREEVNVNNLDATPLAF